MNTVITDSPENNLDTITGELVSCLQQQRKAYLADPVPDYARRKADLLALKRMISENCDAFIGARYDTHVNIS